MKRKVNWRNQHKPKILSVLYSSMGSSKYRNQLEQASILSSLDDRRHRNEPFMSDGLYVKQASDRSLHADDRRRPKSSVPTRQTKFARHHAEEAGDFGRGVVTGAEIERSARRACTPKTLASVRLALHHISRTSADPLLNLKINRTSVSKPSDSRIQTLDRRDRQMLNTAPLPPTSSPVVSDKMGSL